MEKGSKISKVNNICDTLEVLFLASAMAEINPLMVEGGEGLRHGIIIYVENREESDIILRYMKDTGAIFFNSLARNDFKVPNYKFAVHQYNLYDKP